MESNEYKQLMDEIEKLKFHNTNLLTLMGSLNDEKMQQPTIHETIVMFDLSKNDLRAFTELVQNYEGEIHLFEQKALGINAVFRRNNIISILKSFVTSEIVEKKSKEILVSYETD